MIIDSSAIVAILRHEPDAQQFAEALTSTASGKISAATLLEVSIVTDRMNDPVLRLRLDEMLRSAQIQVVDVTLEQVQAGRQANRDFGKRSGHAAGLNFGDCFAYALAKVTGEPLLYKGDDFVHTDLRSVLG